MTSDWHKAVAAVIATKHAVKMQQQADRLVTLLADEGLHAEAQNMLNISAACEVFLDGAEQVAGFTDAMATTTDFLSEIGVDA